MKTKSGNTVVITDEVIAEVEARITPELLDMLDAMTDEEIAAQIAANPDAAPALDEAWFERARLVIPLKGRKKAA